MSPCGRVVAYYSYSIVDSFVIIFSIHLIHDLLLFNITCNHNRYQISKTSLNKWDICSLTFETNVGIFIFRALYLRPKSSFSSTPTKSPLWNWKLFCKKRLSRYLSIIKRSRANYSERAFFTFDKIAAQERVLSN